MENLLNLLNKSEFLVVYPCAGYDWMALTFTTKEFLDYRINNDDVQKKIEFYEPDIFVYIDKYVDYKFLLKEKLLFEDKYTVIHILKSCMTESPFEECYEFDVEWTSKFKPDWAKEDLPSRKKKLIFIKSDWKLFSSFMYFNHIKSYIGIGITDGCAFGRNTECVNLLDTPMHKTCNLDCAKPSKYWITDHFTDYRNPDQLKNGDYIHSIHDYFPFKFKKLALLSTNWGRYGWGCIRGATLFKIEDVNR